MTIEGAIAQLQELIDNEGIPFWAKPSLQKVMETVEMEREQHIEERNNNSDMVSRNDVISICNILADKMDDEGRVAVEQVRDAVKDMRPYPKTCRDCKVAYDSEECYECTANVQNTSAPTIEERKTGKWEYFNLFRTCSVCRATIGEKDDFNDWIPDKYCPNCGAKMEVDE